MIKAFLASLALAIPAYARIVLAQLGIGILSYVSVTSTITGLLNVVKTQYNNIPVAVLQLANMAGFGDGLGIIVAAISARMAIQFLPKLQVLPSE